MYTARYTVCVRLKWLQWRGWGLLAVAFELKGFYFWLNYDDCSIREYQLFCQNSVEGSNIGTSINMINFIKHFPLAIPVPAFYFHPVLVFYLSHQSHKRRQKCTVYLWWLYQFTASNTVWHHYNPCSVLTTNCFKGIKVTIHHANDTIQSQLTDYIVNKTKVCNPSGFLHGCLECLLYAQTAFKVKVF